MEFKFPVESCEMKSLVGKFLWNTKGRGKEGFPVSKCAFDSGIRIQDFDKK